MDVAHGGMPVPRTCMLPFLNPTSIVVAFCRCWSNADASSLLYEPPYTEPYVRWCGRTAEVTPPPTLLSTPPYVARGVQRALVGVSFENFCNVVTDRKARLPHIARRSCHVLVFVEFRPREEISAKDSLLSGKRAKGQKDLPAIRVYRTSEQVLDFEIVITLLTRNPGREVKAVMIPEIEDRKSVV